MSRCFFYNRPSDKGSTQACCFSTLTHFVCIWMSVYATASVCLSEGNLREWVPEILCGLWALHWIEDDWILYEHAVFFEVNFTNLKTHEASTSQGTETFWYSQHKIEQAVRSVESSDLECVSLRRRWNAAKDGILMATSAHIEPSEAFSLKFSLMGVKVGIFWPWGGVVFYLLLEKMISHKIILCSEMTFLVL